MAEAGQKGAITIATNMAGRGTDIKLDKELDLTQEEAGLQIIGTERHESRRIDRQLRGRSGRQGDPGQSIFFLSLEDDLMRLFGSDRIARLDGQERRRGGRGHHRRARHPGHRAGAEAGRAAELPGPEAAARVRRRDEPAARGDLLAAALRAGEGRGAQGRGAPDDRRRAGARGAAVPGRRRARPRSTTAAALREALLMQYLVAADDVVERRGDARHGRDRERGAGRGRGGVPAEARVPRRLREDASAWPTWTARCCRR